MYVYRNERVSQPVDIVEGQTAESRQDAHQSEGTHGEVQHGGHNQQVGDHSGVVRGWSASLVVVGGGETKRKLKRG